MYQDEDGVWHEQEEEEEEEEKEEEEERSLSPEFYPSFIPHQSSHPTTTEYLQRHVFYQVERGHIIQKQLIKQFFRWGIYG